jgi:hypothetical protein
MFLRLEWKSFTRSASFTTNLALKIILGVIAAFYSLMILFLGIAAYYAFAEEKIQPLQGVNQFLIYWWLFDLIFRYFLQKAPVMWVKPFLALPVSKRKITHYLLRKSAFSFFNIYPAFFFLPFSVAMVYNGYFILNVLAWHTVVFAITYCNNYINLMANNKEQFLIGTIGILATFVGLDYFHIFSIAPYSRSIFSAFYLYPWLALVFIALLAFLYRYNFNHYFKALYLDDAVQVKTKVAGNNDYSWLNKYGLMGTFLKNDIRLILRNKRSKNTLIISIFFLFYGLLIMTNEVYENSIFWLIFIGVFVPGGFLFTFGGFVPSWDSAYYPLMMSQNIRYKEYLSSKWWLIVVATALSMLLTVFYWFIEPRYYYAILAGGIYNIGINAYIVLLSGAFVKTPIDLTTGKKPFGDKSSFNVQSILLTIPKILLPVAVFYGFHQLGGETVGFLGLAAFGLLGLVFRNYFFTLIEKVYKQEKYSTIQAYKQKG